MSVLVRFVLAKTWVLIRRQEFFFVFFADVAIEREVEGDLLLGDMGCGMPFRAGTFDGVIR